MTKYHQLRLAMDEGVRAGTWSIDDYVQSADGVEIDAAAFYSAKEWGGAGALSVDIVHPGRPLPIDMLALEALIVARDVLPSLRPFFRNAQIIPLTVAGHGARHDYALCNILDAPDCLVLDQSEYTPWGPDEDRPWRNRLGQAFGKPAIAPEKVRDLHVFRLMDWGQNRLIVSDEAKACIESIEGVRHEFWPVRVTR